MITQATAEALVLARERGFVRVANQKIANEWFLFCRKASWPFVAVRGSQAAKRLTVELDMDTVDWTSYPRPRIPQPQVDAIFDEFKRLAHETKMRPLLSGGNTHMHSYGLDEDRAEQLAAFMFKAAMVKIPSWMQEVHVTSRDPLVKFFKDRARDGQFATITTATEAAEFLREVSQELPHVLSVTAGDEKFTLDQVLPQVCDIWAKLRGYKADNVYEERRLIAGRPHPEGQMDYLNADEPLRASDLIGDSASHLEQSSTA